MLRKDIKEDMQKCKKKLISTLLMLVTALIILAALVIDNKKSSHSGLENPEQSEVQETVTETRQAQELQDETETESMWEDNGPDARDVPEDIDAAYQQREEQNEPDRKN